MIGSSLSPSVFPRFLPAGGGRRNTSRLREFEAVVTEVGGIAATTSEKTANGKRVGASPPDAPGWNDGSRGGGVDQTISFLGVAHLAKGRAQPVAHTPGKEEFPVSEHDIVWPREERAMQTVKKLRSSPGKPGTAHVTEDAVHHGQPRPCSPATPTRDRGASFWWCSPQDAAFSAADSGLACRDATI